MKQREIKFRAWDFDKKEMLPPQDLSQPRSYWKWLGEFDFPLMQYTGLEDKNGREIYEGDIVRNQEAIRLSKLGMINPTLERMGINPPEWLTIIKDIRILPFYEGQTNDEVEVVGNIYENPDLLK